jgi:hypothetical protein
MIDVSAPEPRPPFVDDVGGARVLVRDPTPALLEVLDLEWRNRGPHGAIEIDAAGDEAMAAVLSRLRDLDVAFAGGSGARSPATVFETLRDKGLVAGPYSRIAWRGPGRWERSDA